MGICEWRRPLYEALDGGCAGPYVDGATRKPDEPDRYGLLQHSLCGYLKVWVYIEMVATILDFFHSSKRCVAERGGKLYSLMPDLVKTWEVIQPFTR